MSAVVQFIADESEIRKPVNPRAESRNSFYLFYSVLPDRTFLLDSLKLKQSKVHSLI